MALHPLEYVPISEATRPLLEAVNLAHEAALEGLGRVFDRADAGTSPEQFENITAAVRELYDVIERTAPRSEDKAAALRSAALARMAANAAIKTPDAFGDHRRRSLDHLAAACWLACKAIAHGIGVNGEGTR